MPVVAVVAVPGPPAGGALRVVLAVVVVLVALWVEVLVAVLLVAAVAVALLGPGAPAPRVSCVLDFFRVAAGVVLLVWAAAGVVVLVWVGAAVGAAVVLLARVAAGVVVLAWWLAPHPVAATAQAPAQSVGASRRAILKACDGPVGPAGFIQNHRAIWQPV